jgi:sugar phosphate isomerase/epimerase
MVTAMRKWDESAVREMLFGAPASSVEDIDRLRSLGFDFAEIIIPNATARRVWWESGISNTFAEGFFLIAHGPPVEELYNDIHHLRNHYLPALLATIDTASRLKIEPLTVHLLMDSQHVSPLVLAEKRRALRELVDYGLKSGVTVCLENLSESADDLEAVMETVPDLRLTLDVAHAQLSTMVNRSFDIIRRLGQAIRHIHFSDNRGGDVFNDDLHLPIGKGIVEFPAILVALVHSGCTGTVSLEVKAEHLLESRNRIQQMLDDVATMSPD